MRLKIIILLFCLISKNVNAQTIILNDCWLKDILEKDKFVKTRDVVIDLQRKKLSIQGIDKEDKPYMVQDALVVDAISTGFVKGKTLSVANHGILEKRYTFDLVNGKYTADLYVIRSKELGHSEDKTELLQSGLIICSGLNGQLIGNNNSKKEVLKKKNKKENGSESGAKSLLEKLLKRD